MALDHGTVRIGVALSDPLGILASPLTTLDVKGWPLERKASEILRLVERHNPEELIIGVPYHLDGRENEQTSLVRSLMTELKEKGSIPLVEWDERLTSKQAERALHERGLSHRKQRPIKDQLAAVFILQSYLDARR